MEIFKLFGRILVDDKEAQNSLSRTDKNTKSLGERLRGGIKMAALWGTALVGAAVGVGAAMFGLVNKATQAADAIAKGAARMGVSTDFYQEMDYWASQNGLSHDQMEKAIGRFNQRIGKALDGNDKYSNALERLGVNLDEVRDGSISTEDAFAKSIQTLSEMENEHEKVALATEMFGDAMARDLLPALQDGSLSIEEARKKAQELGLVLSEDQIKASEEFQDSWDTIKRSLGAAATQIGLDLMPMFQKLLDWVIDKLPAIREMFSKVFGFIREASLWVVERVQLIMDWLSQWFDDNQSSLAGIWDTFLHYLTLVKDFVEEAFVFIKQIIKDILDAVVPFIQEQLDKIMKFWEENGKQIMQAVQNVFNFIKGVIEFIFPIIVAIIQGAWGLIKNAFDTAVNIIMGIVKVFSSLLTGDFEGVRSALIGIWEDLWNGIKGIIAGAWNLVSGVFGALWNNIEGWFTGLVSDAIGWGKDLIRGFWEGISGMGTWIKNKVTSFIDSVVPGPIKSVLGIASPSKLMMEYGEDTGEGLALGMEDSERRVSRVAYSMAETVKSPMSDTNNDGGYSKYQGTIGEGETSTIEQLLMELIEAVKEGKFLQMDGKTFAKLIGDDTDEEGGHRLRLIERGLAT